MKIYLLTHEREFARKTNTGALAKEAIPNIIERILWERKKPNKTLIDLIDNNDLVLLYPNTDVEDGAKNEEDSPGQGIQNFVLIDSTWQEARKIYNQSPYLQLIQTKKLFTKTESKYTLRRNQQKGRLCTVECVLELLRIEKMHDFAENLESRFDIFNRRQGQ